MTAISLEEDGVDWSQLPDDLLFEIQDLLDGTFLGPRGILNRLKRGIPFSDKSPPSRLLSARLSWVLNRKNRSTSFDLVPSLSLVTFSDPAASVFTPGPTPFLRSRLTNLSSLTFEVRSISSAPFPSSINVSLTNVSGLTRLVLSGPLTPFFERTLASDREPESIDPFLPSFITILRSLPNLSELHCNITHSTASLEHFDGMLQALSDYDPLDFFNPEQAFSYFLPSDSPLPLRTLSLSSFTIMRLLKSPYFFSLLRNLQSIALDLPPRPVIRGSTPNRARSHVPLPLSSIDAASYPQLRHVSIGPSLFLSPSSLQSLLTLPLKSLSIHSPEGSSLSTSLSSCTSLRHLSLLSFDSTSLPSLAPLASLDGLRSLHLEGATLKGLDDLLSSLLPTLRYLSLRLPPLPPASFDHLFASPAVARLRTLELCASRLLLDGRFLAALPTRCPKLERLALTFDFAFDPSLEGSPRTATLLPLTAALVSKSLGRLQELRSLSLHGEGRAWVTGVLPGLMEGALRGVKSLTELDLGSRGTVPNDLLFLLLEEECALPSLRRLRIPEISGLMLSDARWPAFADRVLAPIDEVEVTFIALSSNPYLGRLVERGVLRVRTHS